MTEEPIKNISGTYRTMSVEETLNRAEPARDYVGITRVANITGLDFLGIPTCMVVRPMAKSLSVSQGKGLSLELAMASGIMEAIEIYHAENLPAGEKYSLTHAAKSSDFVSPTDLPLRANAQFSKLNKISWLKAVNLFTGKECWVPRELCDLDSTVERKSSGLFRSSTVGLASGNTLLEAVTHGLLEAIEHDCVAFWQVQGLLDGNLNKSRIALKTIDDKNCIQLVKQCSKAGLKLAVWDATGEQNIPCFVATIFDESGSTLFPARANGYGCHAVASVALSRAITEAAQSRLTRISGVRDDLSWSHFDKLNRKSNQDRQQISELSYEGTPSLDYRTLQNELKPNTSEQLLNWILDRINIESLCGAMYVDLTDKNLGIPVAYTLVPRLEYSDESNRYVPGPRMSEFMSNAF